MRKTLIIVVSIFIFIAICLLGYYYFVHQDKKPKSDIKVLNTIEDYNYQLDNRDTPYYKENFNNLKLILESDNIDYTEYSKYVATLFVTDLYTIKNKINKYDVGGVEFIYPDNKANFVSKVEDTLYKYIIDNSDNLRTQTLPVVNNVEILSNTKANIKVNDETYSGYIIELKISYEIDLNYDELLTLELIENDKYIYVTRITPQENQS